MTPADPVGAGEGARFLELADWRRRVAELYAEVRARATTDPADAWARWRGSRESLYREHPQSPVPASARDAFRAAYWDYDPAWRFEVDIEIGSAADAADGGPGAASAFSGRPAENAEPLASQAEPTAPAEPAASPFAHLAPISFLADAAPAANVAPGRGIELPMSTGEPLSFTRLGTVRVALLPGQRMLTIYWMAGYSGGLFLPFRDATNGAATYGAGRYLLDTAKSADLGGDVAAGRLILDFNFAFHPSCAFDPRWSCPLAPPENRLDVPVEAGERLP